MATGGCQNFLTVATGIFRRSRQHLTGGGVRSTRRMRTGGEGDRPVPGLGRSTVRTPRVPPTGCCRDGWIIGRDAGDGEVLEKQPTLFAFRKAVLKSVQLRTPGTRRTRAVARAVQLTVRPVVRHG